MSTYNPFSLFGDDPNKGYGDVGFPAPPSPPVPFTPTPTPTPAPTPTPSVPRPPAPNAPKPPPTPDFNEFPLPGPNPSPDQNAGAPGTCPPGQVWRTDTNQCEAPDARSKAGKETCTGPMPQCPGGQAAWCNFDTAQWECAKSVFSDAELLHRLNKIRAAQGKPPLTSLPAGQGGGGGGKGGSKSSANASYGPSQGSNDFNTLLGDEIKKALAAPSRYTPEALQALYGQITAQSAGQIARNSAAVRADAARRGMSRAGSVDAALRGVRDAAEQQRGASNVGVLQAKITADYQDKMGALDRAQQYLNSLRDSEYRYALMAEQRRQFDANLTLAYANLAQQKAMLQMQLQSQWDMLRANQGFSLLGGGV